MQARKHLVPAVLAALLVPAAAAQAATDTTSITLTGGSLTYGTPLTAGDFPSTALNGLPQLKTATINPYAVTDARGGSAGWHLTIEASQFDDGDGNTLPTGSLTMALPPVPTTDLSNVLAVPPVPAVSLTPIDAGGAQTIASAAALPLSGAGTWTFTPLTGLTLSVPPAAVPGTYTSTITTTLATGP